MKKARAFHGLGNAIHLRNRGRGPRLAVLGGARGSSLTIGAPGRAKPRTVWHLRKARRAEPARAGRHAAPGAVGAQILRATIRPAIAQQCAERGRRRNGGGRCGSAGAVGIAPLFGRSWASVVCARSPALRDLAGGLLSCLHAHEHQAKSDFFNITTFSFPRRGAGAISCSERGAARARLWASPLWCAISSAIKCSTFSITTCRKRCLPSARLENPQPVYRLTPCGRSVLRCCPKIYLL